MRYHVMRQDDNGNQVVVECYVSEIAAQRHKVALESQPYLHKQLYWVENAESCEHSGVSS